MKAAEAFEPYIREIAYSEAIKAIEERAEDLAKAEFITLAQAKKDYGLHGATLYRRVHDGYLNLYGIGGKSLLKRSEVERLIVKRPPRPHEYARPRKKQQQGEAGK